MQQNTRCIIFRFQFSEKHVPINAETFALKKGESRKNAIQNDQKRRKKEDKRVMLQEGHTIYFRKESAFS